MYGFWTCWLTAPCHRFHLIIMLMDSRSKGLLVAVAHELAEFGLHDEALGPALQDVLERVLGESCGAAGRLLGTPGALGYS